MTTRLISIDFETRSPVDLKVAGLARYCEHPDTDVWCMAYQTPDGVKVWQREDVMLPYYLQYELINGAFLCAWNASFERGIWNNIMVPKYGWPALPTERFVCAMALSASAALPLMLDKAARALGVNQQKDMDGHRLMLRMCKPRETHQFMHQWWNEPEKRAQLSAYCAQDVRTEMAVWARLPAAMNARERQIWLMDQRINDRGIALDLPLVRAAHDLVRRIQPTIAARIAEITGGITITQVAKLKEWLQDRMGVYYDIDSLDKASVAKLLENGLEPDVRLVLEARQDGAKSSTSKYAAMLAAVCADGRVRGTMQYYAATTGRWGGRGIQPHNFPKPSRKITPEMLTDILAGDLEWIEMLYGPAMLLLSDALRSCFVAARGKMLAVADYSTIEARIVAWLAGQDDLVALFAGGGKVYEVMAAAIFGGAPEDYDPDSNERDIGKRTVLGCGFGMGAKKFRETVIRQGGADPTEALAKLAVKIFRSTYPRIVDLWSNMNRAANEATLGHCEVVVSGTNGLLRFEATGGYLLLHLPSGRPLWYHAPEVHTYIVHRTETVVDPLTGEEHEEDRSFEATGVEISTLDALTKQWRRVQMYGGIWTENAVQAIARDIMADAMLRCQNAEVDVVLSVHDEVVAEVEHDLPLRTFVNLLTELPPWAAGCPIDAKGWIEERYRK